MHRTSSPLALTLLLFGCGGEESARAECEALKETYCASAMSCVPPEPAATYQQLSDYCGRRLDSAINCAEAGSVSSSYDRCLTEIAALACDEPSLLSDPNIGLPRSCVGVIRMR
jgi:hypothetical protein